MKNIDHKSTMNITCPYCGWEDQDSWEATSDSGKMDCGRCEKEFDFERTVTVDYSTYKNEADCDHDGQTIYCDYCGKNLQINSSASEAKLQQESDEQKVFSMKCKCEHPKEAHSAFSGCVRKDIKNPEENCYCEQFEKVPSR